MFTRSNANEKLIVLDIIAKYRRKSPSFGSGRINSFNCHHSGCGERRWSQFHFSSSFFCCRFWEPELSRSLMKQLRQGAIPILVIKIDFSATLKQEVEQIHEVHCSRERSRAAWKAIQEYLIPFVDEERYQLPKKCRLNPENDMFRDQEQHKIHVQTNEWRCGFCKKSFRAEKFLDQHFDNRHYNLLNDSQGRCLADLCGALHCDFVTDSKKMKNKCNPAAAARNRHLCESLSDSCFPLNNGQSASRLHEFFLRQFCDAHTCTGGKKPFSRGGKKESSVFYLAVCILVVMLLPLFYTLVYLQQREMKKGLQVLKRISKPGLKSKPS